MFIPSSALVLPKNIISGYVSIDDYDEPPRVGDVMFGQIESLGQHREMENRSGRIHNIYTGSKCIFVYGNRYAPDAYEGFVPKKQFKEVDLLARSGVIGELNVKNALISDPTRVRVIGHICDKNGMLINTTNFPNLARLEKEKKKNRAKLIVVCGTAMNSGKSYAAAACVRSLAELGKGVQGSKITGTASLKDILAMQDSGASSISDFTQLGYPSTYMVTEPELEYLFNRMDLTYGSKTGEYWVVELADGISQRETAKLLKMESVRSRIHKIIFCAQDAFGAIGGMNVLKEDFDLEPDAISGLCTVSPLHIEEMKSHVDIPIFDTSNYLKSRKFVEEHLL